MTPGARLAAAADILDQYLAGTPAERALTSWARASRFAGSGDRAAVRDQVFDAIRQRRSAAATGGSETGRGLVIGLLRLQGKDPNAFLTGQGYAMAPLTHAERSHSPAMSETGALDCPDWLASDLRESLDGAFTEILQMFRSRADVFLRVNTVRTTRSDVQAALARDGIQTEPHPLSATALGVLEGARRIHMSTAYATGLVELQDAASQAVSDAIPLPTEGRVLDYCAGGGGKALALAARFDGQILAHDADPNRMKDLPDRAARARAEIRAVTSAEVDRLAPFALVVADVPCSGSGAWRRQPEAKWRLDRPGLDRLLVTQAAILQKVADLTAPDGAVAYVTCSLLRCENEDQVARFLAHRPGWSASACSRVSPLEGGDGFFLAILRPGV